MHFITHTIVFLTILYGLSILSQFSTFFALATTILTPLQSLVFLATLPFFIVLSNNILATFFLILHSALLTAYLTLLRKRLSIKRHERLAYGLSASLFSVFSIGCVACGSLITPLLLATSLGVPLSVLGWWKTFSGLLSAILLILGCILLLRQQNNTLTQ